MRRLGRLADNLDNCSADRKEHGSLTVAGQLDERDDILTMMR